MGELTFFLGLQVKQKDDGIFISQDKYVANILKKFDFATVKTASTPIKTNKALLKDEEAEDVDVHLYRSIIGSLMIFTYLKGQPKLGLWYPRDSPFDLEAFSDSDYAGASLDRRSTIREPFNDTYETSKHTQKVFANMRRKGKSFSGTITPLFQSMLAIQTVEGKGSGQPSEPQPTPSPALPLHEFSGPPKKVGDKAVYTGEDDRVVRTATTASSLEAERESVNTSGSGEDSMEHQDDLTDFVPLTPHDLPLLGGHTPGSDEGRPNINELMAICTNMSNRVLALETSKTAQDLVINKLKKKVKRLEKKQRARTPGMKLFKIEDDFDDDFDDIDDMVNEASIFFGLEPRTPPTTTTTAFEDEDLTIAQTLVKMIKIAQRLFEEEQAQFEREQRIARERAIEQEAKDERQREAHWGSFSIPSGDIYSTLYTGYGGKLDHNS
ncbi:hypothetical protein Tco_1217845 [Tanacetum coccineum]